MRRERSFADKSRAILAVSPQKEGLAVPTGRRAPRRADARGCRRGDRLERCRQRQSLMEATPDPGAIKDRREIEQLGVTVVRFANGVEAWLKPTDFKNDQVLFSLVAQGGASLARAGPIPRRGAGAGAGAVLGRGRAQCRGSSEAACRQDRRRARSDQPLDPQHRRVRESGQPRNGPAAPPSDLHCAGQRPGGVRHHPEAARRDLHEPRQNPALLYGEKVAQVNSGNHYTAEPITLERLSKLDRNAMARVLSGAIRERRRFHLPDGRHFQDR